MKEFWINILTLFGLAWWVEVITESPSCVYYFGPFATPKEAEAAKSGYIEDLEEEGAKGIKTAIKRCKPAKLTIFDEAAESSPHRKIFPILSGQL
ncbi:DUF1816 domain-containing protein [Phormidium tenue FACHB-886]|nr:DUF1816 domain-containing protein [Phormidium tenue FACHB-886]